MKNAKELMLEYTAFSFRDPKTAAEMFAEDGAFELPYLATFGLPTQYRGRDAIAGFFQSVLDIYPGFKFENTNVLIDTPDQAFAEFEAIIRSFARTWTTDLKDRRIRSNVVSPGPIDTPLASRQSADVIARIVSTIPMGRMGKPEEVAKAALYLASDDSSFVTGIELFVDGGRAQV